MNTSKTEYMCFNQEVAISILKVGSLKLVDKFMYLTIRVSSIESDVSIYLANAWTVIDHIEVWSIR